MTAAAADDWFDRGAQVRTSGRATLVDPAEAADVLAIPGLVVLDCRDADAFENERLRGATLFDDDSWKQWSLDPAIGVRDVEAWRAEAARYGVDGRRPVLLVDDGSMTRAPRIWFILARLGIHDVMVADGGYPAWRDSLGDDRLTCGVDERVASVLPASGVSAPAPIRWLDRVDMLRLLGDGRVQLVDVRSVAEFDGSKPLKNPRGGHLPGAIVLPHKTLLAEDGRVRSPRDIHDILAAHGIDSTRPIVLYCQSGARASLAALALARSGVDALACYYEGLRSLVEGRPVSGRRRLSRQTVAATGDGDSIIFSASSRNSTRPLTTSYIAPTIAISPASAMARSVGL